MKKNTKEKLIGSLVLLVLLHIVIVYVFDVTTGQTRMILQYINPFTIISFYIKYPLISVVIFGLIILYWVITYESENELVLEHEDQGRLANSNEITEAFGTFDPKEVFKNVKK